MLRRTGDLLTGLLAFSLGSVLAWHYPLGQIAALAFFLGTSILAFFRLSWFLVILPLMLPVIGLAPWTGWITFEEVDLLVLAMASGGYTRALIAKGQAGSRCHSWLLAGLSFLMAVSILISMARGFSDAGGFKFGWFQGYDGPMNSIRIGKSFFLALLLLPLLRRLQRDPGQEVGRKLAWGMALGLGSASLAALWERLAFTDLLNFSSDYRSTALFWEMHVGGAALDGWLLLTLPFATWTLRNSRNLMQHALSLALILLGVYAALTTFSRGVYLAILVALLLLALQARKRRGFTYPFDRSSWSALHWILALVTLGAMAFLVFPGGGYRGLIVLLGVIAVALSMPLALRNISISHLAGSSVLGMVLGAALFTLVSFVPKGPYLLWLGLFGPLLAFLFRSRTELLGKQRFHCATVFFALLISTAGVANHWGGREALWGMIGALSIVVTLILRGIFAEKPLWPGDFRWQATFMSAAIAVSSVAVVFIGGGYMSERFSTSGQDFKGRLSHWSQSVSMLQTPMDVAFGKGLGRFPANYFFAVPDGKFPGTYKIFNQENVFGLSMVGARHPMGFGDIFRVSQRLNFDVSGPFDVLVKFRNKTDVSIHLEVCEKHLLYVAACAIGRTSAKASNGAWQVAQVRLSGPLLNGGAWFAPRIKMFSLGVNSPSGLVEIDALVLSSSGGSNLLLNSDFSNDMQNWFFSSDRDHMPWHAKNIFINVLFDQGVVGLTILLLLTLTALFRLGFGNASQNELSPYFLVAISGFLVVGLFDSLLDVPRVALVFYLLILYSLSFVKENSGSNG